MKNINRFALAAFACLAIPASAGAHGLHDGAGGFGAGMSHPVLGLDHLLAMVAVGLWAAQIGRRALWAVPGAFVVTMVLGGLLGLTFPHLPMVEHGILASVFVAGLFVAVAMRVPLGAAMCIAAVFALFHGYAHGTEMPANATGAAYFAGFALATAALHMAGIGVSALAAKAKAPVAVRIAGGAVCVAAVALAIF